MQIETGAVLEGRVTGIKPFGAFVELEPGVSGMVHISEVSNAFVENIAEVLQMGQTVRVRVLSVSPEGRIALSIKKALPPESRGRQGGQSPRVWQPPRRSENAAPLSFEDMMNRYKQSSEERLNDLNRAAENRRGGSRRK